MSLTVNENEVRQIGYAAAEQFARRLADRSDDFTASGDEVLIGEQSMVQEYGSPLSAAAPFLVQEMEAVNLV